MVQTGYIPYIKIENVSAREAFKALLVPLNLYYKLGPGFIFISTPELLAKTEFVESKPLGLPESAPKDPRDVSGAALPPPVPLPTSDISRRTDVRHIATIVIPNDGNSNQYFHGEKAGDFQFTVIVPDTQTATPLSVIDDIKNVLKKE